jgi:uncharacterized membrane protein
MTPHSHSDDANQPSRPATAVTPKRAPFRRRLRAYFLTGIVVAAPLAITVYITLWFINFIGRRMAPLIEPFVPASHDFVIALLGVLVMVAFLTLLGALTTNIAGRTIVGYGERLLARVPVIRTLYNGLKHIIETLISQSRGSFNKVGLIQYPRPGIWSLVFIATETADEIVLRSQNPSMVSVFLPHTPNPTSGFLLFVPKVDVIVLDMTVEEAAKYLLSLGLTVPQHRAVTGLERVAPPAQARENATPQLAQH